jgi:5-deoxy-glucuronate isomerase
VGHRTTIIGGVSLLLRAGEWERVTPESAGWRYLSFRVERIAGADERDTGPAETALVLLEGACSVEVDGRRFELGPRASVFAQLPWTVYLPRDTDYRLEGEAELAIASARCSVRREPVLQRPDEVAVEVRGAGNATRQINNMIQPGFPAERLLVVEVLTPAGNWSSYPPHKHDVHRTGPGGKLQEADLEEIYFYKIDKPDGYAYQRVYNDDRSIDALVMAQNHDTVLIPEGYHPVVSAHGYTTYYLNFLAGTAQSLASADDPTYASIKDTWTSKDPRVPVVSMEMER